MPDFKTMPLAPRRSGAPQELGADGVLRHVEPAAETLPRRVLRSDPVPTPAPAPAARVKKG